MFANVHVIINTCHVASIHTTVRANAQQRLCTQQTTMHRQ